MRDDWSALGRAIWERAALIARYVGWVEDKGQLSGYTHREHSYATRRVSSETIRPVLGRTRGYDTGYAYRYELFETLTRACQFVPVTVSDGGPSSGLRS